MNNLAAHGTFTHHGTPKSASSITPFLVIPYAKDAIVFHQRVFGARIVDVTEIHGVVAHAVLDFGNGLLQVGEPQPEYHLVAPPPGDDDCYSMGPYGRDVDSVTAQAVSEGPTLREPVTNFVSGDRFASIRDPFGVHCRNRRVDTR